jgi:hypothetical protein
MVAKGGFGIMIDYVLFTTQEWETFKSICNWGEWVDHARYHDKYECGSKIWWIHFKTPLLNSTFLYFAIEMGKHIERNKS